MQKFYVSKTSGQYLGSFDDSNIQDAINPYINEKEVPSAPPNGLCRYINGEWVYPSETGEEIEKYLTVYRDQYIEQEVSHNGVTVLNTKENRVWISSLELRWKSENSSFTIKFKNVDDTRVDASLSDIQGLQKLMFEREQKGRNVEDVVLANNELSAYTDETWKTDFDAEVGE